MPRLDFVCRCGVSAARAGLPEGHYLRVWGELARGSPPCVTNWQTTSRHLRQLEEAGLISVGLQGRERVYTLNGEYMLELLDQWADRFR